MTWPVSTLAILLLLSVAAGPASAQGRWDPPLTVARSERGHMTLAQAAAMVRRETGGRVLAAVAQKENGRTVYRIKVLTPGGRVVVVLVDAGTGAILNRAR